MVGFPSNVLVISDCEGYRFKINLKYSIDFILSLGDNPIQVLNDVYERYRKPIYAVKGNHDSSAPLPDFVIDVHFKVICERNWLIGGWEGVPQFKDEGTGMFDDFIASDHLRSFPRVDVFLCHSPLLGKTDLDDPAHRGSQAILDYVTEKQPKYLFHGHVHQEMACVVGETKVVSVYGHKVVHLR
jgi:Icc-related predicted phosphoesterase